jgi:alanine dehydrogenase
MRDHGGQGLLLGGVPGVPPCEVIVLGAGTAGENAARLAIGMGASVKIMDINMDRLAYIDDLFNGRITTIMSDDINIERYVPQADLLIGAVLVPGELAPKVVPVSVVKKMKPGSVIVDIAVDQGGCIATTHPTSHDNPVYKLHNVVHYGVPNMPGAVSKTSTQALANAVFPYALKIAQLGLEKAVAQSDELRKGVNIYAKPGQAKGVITNPGVAQAFGVKCVPIEKAACLK